MSTFCHHDYYAAVPEGDRGFEVDATRVRFGRGLLAETGAAARTLGITRAALFSDATVAKLPFTQHVRDSLGSAGVAFEEYNDISIEPTDRSFHRAIEFAKDGRFDGYISVGGGSTIDTAKAVNLYTTYPTANFADYVNAPIGGGKPIPGPLKPHIACPTTSGTGSECTGIVVFDFVERKAEDGHCRSRAQAVARHHRCGSHVHASPRGRGLHRALTCSRTPSSHIPRARIHGASTYPGSRGRFRRGPTHSAISAAWKRYASSEHTFCGRFTTRMMPKRGSR